MALVPSASSLWTGDPTLEPLLEEMHAECSGKLKPVECVALLRKAEWRLPLGVALGTVELQSREIGALAGELARSFVLCRLEAIGFGFKLDRGGFI